MCVSFSRSGKEKYLALTFNQGTKIHSKYRKWRAFNTGDWSSRRGKHGAPKQRAGKEPCDRQRGKGCGQDLGQGPAHPWWARGSRGYTGKAVVAETPREAEREGERHRGFSCSDAPVSCRCCPAVRLTWKPGK